jgi:hypothetical protein
MTDLDTWRALGPALERLVAAGARAMTVEYQEHLRGALIAGGVEEDDPLLARVQAITPRLADGELGMRASIGLLGPRMRELHGEWRAADELHGMWRAIDEALEYIGDPWESLREELANSVRSPPEDALAALGALTAEIDAMGRAPFGTWPLVATGERRSDLIGQALTQVSERTGIARDQLLPVPSDLDEEPVLVWTDGAQAIEALHEWMLERQGRARTLGRLVRLLPPAKV